MSSEDQTKNEQTADYVAMRVTEIVRTDCKEPPDALATFARCREVRRIITQALDEAEARGRETILERHAKRYEKTPARLRGGEG